MDRDLISREALIETVFDHCVSMSVCLSKEECDGMKRMRDAIMDDIENAPKVEQEEAEWKTVILGGSMTHDGYEHREECSACHEKNKSKTRFCPNCGKQMRNAEV